MQYLLLLKLSSDLLRSTASRCCITSACRRIDGGIALGQVVLLATGLARRNVMCLAVSMKAVEVTGDMAGGKRRPAPRCRHHAAGQGKIGGWELIHAGFAITKLTKEQARETLASLPRGSSLADKTHLSALAEKLRNFPAGPEPRSWRSAAPTTWPSAASECSGCFPTG